MSSILDLWSFTEISRRDLAAWTKARSTRPKDVIKIWVWYRQRAEFVACHQKQFKRLPREGEGRIEKERRKKEKRNYIYPCANKLMKPLQMTGSLLSLQPLASMKCTSYNVGIQKTQTFNCLLKWSEFLARHGTSMNTELTMKRMNSHCPPQVEWENETRTVRHFPAYQLVIINSHFFQVIK